MSMLTIDILIYSIVFLIYILINFEKIQPEKYVNVVHNLKIKDFGSG